MKAIWKENYKVTEDISEVFKKVLEEVLTTPVVNCERITVLCPMTNTTTKPNLILLVKVVGEIKLTKH